MEMVLFNTGEAAKFLGISKNCLDKWRQNKAEQIPYVKIGTSVKYIKADLIKYVEDHTVR